MNIDLEYDYSEALKRQGHTQADVDAIRNLVSQYPHIPKSITDKQVIKSLDVIIETRLRFTHHSYDPPNSLST